MPTGPAAAKAGQEDIRTCSQIAEEMLSYLGAGTTENAKIRALAALRQEIQAFNRNKLWMDRFLRQDNTLIADTATYTLPARWAGDLGYGFFLDTNGDRRIALRFFNFLDFVQKNTDNSAGSSTPSMWTVENRVSQGTLELYPAPSSGFIATYPTFRAYYFAGIPVCAADEDILAVSQELEAAIFDGALWRLNRMLGDPTRDTFYKVTAVESKRGAFRYDNRLRLASSALHGFP